MRLSKTSLLEKAKNAKRESKYVDFKESFDVDSAQDWCEILKDIVAMANSGGGIILIGANSTGLTSGFDVRSVLSLDPATLTDKINKYSGVNFNDFEIEEIVKGRIKFAGLLVYESRIPIPFSKPGTYSIENGKQKTAFSQGTIYFRHGAKSEPCTSDDLKDVIERNLDYIKRSWLGNIRRVVTAPSGSTMEVLPPNVVVTTSMTATPIRITTDETAPAYQLTDPNKTHPFRGKEILTALHRESGIKLNNFHLQCIRREFKIDDNRPDFYYKPKFGTPQFSKTFLDWLVELYNQDNRIFEKTREKYLKHN